MDNTIKITDNNNKHIPNERLININNVINENDSDFNILYDYDNKYIKNLMEKKDIRDIIPKKYMDIGKVLNKLNSKLLYVKSGSTGHTFKGVNISGGNKSEYAVKIVPYPKKLHYGDMHDSKRPENAEILLIKLLSQFVIKKQNPHIILPLLTFNTSIIPFLNLNKIINITDKNFLKFLERNEKGEYYNNASVLISEWADAGDLLDYFRKKYKTITLEKWTIIFFQLLSVLAVIHNKFPDFKHNDMKANNILVTTNNINKKWYLYNINHQKYYIPIINIQIQLWDFDFSCIKNIIENSKVNTKWANASNITSKRNRYYDIHYFFNSLIKKGFCPEIMTDPDVPIEIKDFINRVVPDNYKTGKDISERGRLLIDTEYTTPDILLKTDPLFDKYRKN